MPGTLRDAVGRSEGPSYRPPDSDAPPPQAEATASVVLILMTGQASAMMVTDWRTKGLCGSSS